MHSVLGGAHIGTLRAVCSLFYDRCFPLAEGRARSPCSASPAAKPAPPACRTGLAATRGDPGPAQAKERVGPRTAPPPAGSRKRPRGWASLSFVAQTGASGGVPGARRRPPERPPGFPAWSWRAASGACWAVASWCQVRSLRGVGTGLPPAPAPYACLGQAACTGTWTQIRAASPPEMRLGTGGLGCDTGPQWPLGWPLSRPPRHTGSDLSVLSASRASHSALSTPTTEFCPLNSTVLLWLPSPACLFCLPLNSLPRPKP